MDTALRIMMVVIVGLTSTAVFADDWPTYRHDNGRTAITSESIEVTNLQPAWIYQAEQPPRKALPGPAKWDAYRETKPLGDAVRFDSVFHPIVVGKRLYYGSSADDAVHCIDTATGEEIWSFTTGGPVRLPPSFYEGKLYFGSDDGYAYCITAAAGRSVWRFSPSEGRRKVFHDGRLISRWPVRTGVSIQEGTAYFAASLLPGNESYLCAVNARTGELQGQGSGMQQTKGGQTFMGMMALSDRFLVAPQGRNNGRVLRVPSLDYVRDGIPGTFAMLTGGHLAGGSSTGTPVAYDWKLSDPSKQRAHVGRFEACYAGETAFLFSHKSLSAFRRNGWKLIWHVRGECRTGIIAGDHVFVGGNDEVRAHNVGDGKQIWKARAWGKVDGLAAANGALYASTTDGLIYCFRANTKAAADPYASFDANRTPGIANANKKPIQIELEAEPYVEFMSPNSFVARWKTEKRSPTILEIGDEGRFYVDGKPKQFHEALIDRLRPTTNYSIKVRTLMDGQSGVTPSYNVDTFFNYALPQLVGMASPYPEDDLTKACRKAAERITRESCPGTGICLVVGCGDGRLAFEIARRTNLCVIGLETDPVNVAAARSALQKTGRYGVRLSIQKISSYDEIETVPGGCANLIVSQNVVSDGKPVGRADEICRLLRPLGGVAVFGQPIVGSHSALDRAQLEAWLASAQLQKNISTEDGLWAVIRRTDPLPGSGEWSHQYGKASNAAFGGETLQGARKVSDLSIQWLGRPGPRHQAERMVRKPAPLVSNGRLFCQGMGRLTAIDIFNGVIMWSLEVPGLERYNMPRDGGNYCADSDHVYLAHDRHCWKIDARTGKVSYMLDTVNVSGRATDPVWSHVSLAGNLLLGTTARKISHFDEYWGSDNWYDHRIGRKTGKICSMSLFALDKAAGKMEWSYAKGLLLNSSITVGGGRVCFVEVRDEKTVGEILANHFGRVYGSLPNTWHVALDVRTGEVLWERPFTGDCGRTAFYQAYAHETLVTVGCSRPYKVHAFDAKTGMQVWSADVKLDGEGHGGATQRPIIVDDKILLCRTAMDLKTGRQLHDCPRGNCGTASASKHALFYRAGDISMWPVSGKDLPTSISQIRSDCWLSMVPGSGMFLATEGGGGCSCGGGLRVSVGLIPRTDLPRFRPAARRFLESLEITIEPPLGGEVFYTTDGSDPTLLSATYRKPIRLTQTTVVRARARGQAPGPALSHCVERHYEKVRPRRLATAGKVNFQPPDAGPNPNGYWIDTGEPVEVRNNGFAYGWTEANYDRSRQDKIKAPELDTLINLKGPLEWQVAVENGRYEVVLGLVTQKDNTGALVCNSVEFAPLQSPEHAEWKNCQISREVAVDNGILAIRTADSNPSSRNMRLTHIVFRKL